ncbi:MAG: carbamoyltransferase HypF [Synechococcaceae cyanobacterium]
MLTAASDPADLDASADPLARLELRGSGVVQGVGLRPRLWQLATELALVGSVANGAGGVVLDLQGERRALERFLERLEAAVPAAARVEQWQGRWLAPRRPGPRGLRIRAARPQALGAGLVAPSLSPDRAPCADCRRELLNPADRRFRYPFVSCSVCGPRYSIATAEPFARARTSLARFRLCAACRREFTDPADRRFHAETIGCPACGPRLRLLDGQAAAADPLMTAVALLRGGGILALQGVGGFQLLVAACDPAAVARLRQRKRRPHKPFALLVEAQDQLADLLTPTPAECDALADPAAPIVLLPCPEARHAAALPGVAPGAPALGVMLPASPLHLLLAREVGAPLVATSGNRSGEPLCIDPAEAVERLAGLADAFLVHDRPIARPLDDSVLQLIDGRPSLLRRARGYAPEALPLDAAGPAVVALGGDLKSAPALAVGDRLWLAPHLGDLADARAHGLWRRGVLEILRREGGALAAVAVDGHPGYGSHQEASARVAELGAAEAVPVRPVAHHRAHGLAVVAEHGLALPCLALCLDGLGYADQGGADEASGAGDAALWGCELLRLEPQGARRLASLRPFPLPGAERAMREPRRSALGLLQAAGLLGHPGALAVREAFAPEELTLLESALQRGLQAPLTSSAGRLFDAVAALLGLVSVASHEAQAGLALQAAADRAAARATDPAIALAGAYPLPLRPGAPARLDWQPMLSALLDDIAAAEPVALCAARFHNGLVAGLAAAVASLAPPPGPGLAPARPPAAADSGWPVALAGGCFQNRLLLEGLIAALRARGLRPYWPERLPINDGGLAAGQILALRQDLSRPRAAPARSPAPSDR